MSQELQQQIDALTKRIDSFEKEHRAFHSSRRGVEGARGETGTPGRNGKDSEIPGPAGRNARVVIGSVVAGEQASASVVEQADGVHVLNLVLPRGLQGEKGAASTVVGPAGQSIVGPAGAPGKDAAPAKEGRDGVNGTNGRDAAVRIGNVLSGDIASVTVRETPEGQVLDFVLPRGERGQAGADSTVPGPKGDRGAAANLTPLEAFQADISQQVRGVSIQLESRLRNIWKSDIQAGLRGHLVESYKN